MGVYLRELLAGDGHEVVVTSRSARKPGGGRVRYVQGDGHDLEFKRGLLATERPDAVVDFMDYATEEFAAHRDALLGGTGHYLFLSSYRVFADDRPVSERSPRLLDVSQDAEYLKTDEYALHKAREENLLRESGMGNWTIVRPCITYSKERFQFGVLEADTVCRRSLQGLPVVMADAMLDKRTTMTWGGDVAKMISRLVLNPKAYGEDFNTVTAESHTWREVAEIYRRAIGMQVREVPLETYIKLTNRTQVMYDRMFDRVMDNSKVLGATGLGQEELMPLERGLVQELVEFAKSPRYRGFNAPLNAGMDKVCGTRTDLAGLTLREKVHYWRHRHWWAGAILGVAMIPKRIAGKLR